MKLKLIFSSLLVFTILLSSCKKEEEEAAATSTTPKEIIMPRVQAIPSGTYVPPNNQNAAPVQSQTITPNQAITQTPVVTKPGMNPPHGQPGHRCDIAVGAPLNSPVAKPASKGTTTMPPATITSIPTATTTTTNPSTPAILNTETTATAPGMNPPHGQEGHVCSIAVGAPLPKK